MNNRFNIGQNAQKCINGGKTEAVSKVVVMYDDNNGFEAGDDTGYTLTVYCPYATQAMANNLLNTAKGFTYQGYQATGLILPPTVELGDAVNVDGLYGMIANRTVSFSPGFTSETTAPYTNDVDHEYGYEGTLQRELKKKVTLGSLYYGTKITRKSGLEITKTDGEVEKSRVVLNSDILAFYNDDGNEALYFDTNAGKFRFVGEVDIREGSININDAFTVDSQGNVVMSGNITLGGNVVFTGKSSFTQVRYSTDSSASVPDGWTENWNSSWNNTSTQVWAIYSYNGGLTWTSPVLIQGKDGSRGPSGSDADVTFSNILSALQRAASTEETFITADSAGAPNIYGGNIYGANIYAGDNSGRFVKINNEGMKVYSGSNAPKILLGWEDVETVAYPFMLLGIGDPSASTTAGMVKKYGNGIWIGDNKDYSATSSVPGAGSQTGIFIDFNNYTISKYLNGVVTDIGGGGGGGTAVFG